MIKIFPSNLCWLSLNTQVKVEQKKTEEKRDRVVTYEVLLLQIFLNNISTKKRLERFSH